MLRKTVFATLVLVVFGVLAVLTFGKTATVTAQGSQAAIWTDKSEYEVGDRARLCYAVPSPAYIEITDILADGNSKVILSGNDDGTGDCLEGTIEPPAGMETLRLAVYSGNRVIATAETRFRVIAMASPPVPVPIPTQGPDSYVPSPDDITAAIQDVFDAAEISSEVAAAVNQCNSVPLGIYWLACVGVNIGPEAVRTISEFAADWVPKFLEAVANMSKPYCDGSEGVYLYEHSGYQGRCSKFTSDSPNPRGWFIGNDAASSISIMGNWTATLYEHDDYQGASSTFTRNESSLQSFAIGNDRASSIRVRRNDTSPFIPVPAPAPARCAPSADQIGLFADVNYGGQCVVRGIGSYPNPSALGLPNDSISSIKVGSNVKAILCRDDNYGGGCETFTSDDSDLRGNSIGNDQVSAARVETRDGCNPDGWEPNNDWGQARLLESTPIMATICPGDDDVYKVAVYYGQTTNLTLTHLPADYDVVLYSGNKRSVVGLSNNGGTDDESIRYWSDQNDVLYIHVYGYNGVSSQRPYSLVLKQSR